MRLAVELVGAGGLEGDGEALIRPVQVILVVNVLSLDTGGDCVFIEHDIVGESLVVDESDRLTSGNGDILGVEPEGTVVTSHLHGGGIGGGHEQQGAGGGKEGLSDGLQGIAAGRGTDDGGHAHHGGGGQPSGGGLGLGLEARKGGHGDSSSCDGRHGSRGAMTNEATLTIHDGGKYAVGQRVSEGVVL